MGTPNPQPLPQRPVNQGPCPLCLHWSWGNSPRFIFIRVLSKGTELWTSALQSAGLMAAQRDGKPRPSMGVGRAESGGGGGGGPRAAGMEGAGSQRGLWVSSIRSHPQEPCRGARLRQESKNSRFPLGTEAAGSCRQVGQLSSRARSYSFGDLPPQA